VIVGHAARCGEWQVGLCVELEGDVVFGGEGVGLDAR